MGAKIKTINSKMCYVKFDISGFEVSYVYNINKNGNYFLERIKPYPLAIKEFYDEEQVIEIIKVDLEQFKNAIKSHNIQSFIDINRRLHQSIQKFEDLFLYYNVPLEECDKIISLLDALDQELKDTKNSSNRIYTKKEPDNL
jgi:hypothetical protein